jgi:hypothetical protein
METQESGPKSFKRVRSAVGRARTGVSGAIGHAPEVAGKARQRAAEVAERLPGALGRAETGARSTVTGLQTMSDSRLRMLAAASVGFGAGLRLAGASRLTTLAGFAPASILGFAIVSRPNPAHLAPHQVQP